MTDTYGTDLRARITDSPLDDVLRWAGMARFPADTAGPCPLCGKERRSNQPKDSKHRLGAVSLRKGNEGWTWWCPPCHGHKSTGGGAHPIASLVTVSVLGKRGLTLRDLSREDWLRVGDELRDIGAALPDTVGTRVETRSSGAGPRPAPRRPAPRGPRVGRYPLPADQRPVYAGTVRGSADIEVEYLEVPHYLATSGTPTRMGWAAFLRHVAQPPLPPAGVPMPPEEIPSDVKRAGRLWCPGVWPSASRAAGSKPETVSALVVDYDEGVSEQDVHRWWGRWTFVAWTTANHGRAKRGRQPAERWRVWLPLARPVSWDDELPRLRTWLYHRWAAVGAPDRNDQGRFIAAPHQWSAEAASTSSRGIDVDPGRFRVLDPDAILAELKAWEEDEESSNEEDQDPGEADTEGDDEWTDSLPELQVNAGPWDGLVDGSELADTLETLPPPREYLLRDLDGRGYLPAGVAAMLCGGGGLGKTTALAQLALAVAAPVEAHGRLAGEDDTARGRWLSTYEVSRPGRVALLLGEEDLDEVRRRLYAASLAAGLRRPGLTSLSASLGRATGGPDRLSEWRRATHERLLVGGLAGRDGLRLTDSRGERTDAWARLWGRLEQGGPWSLIILDPASRYMGPTAEADNNAATRFISSMEALTSLPGRPVVMLSHHTSQASRSAGETSAIAARGVTGLTDAARWVATLTSRRPSEGYAGVPLIRMEVAKSNLAARGAPLTLALDRISESGMDWPVLRRATDEETEAAAGDPSSRGPGPARPAAKGGTRSAASGLP